jgi:hypothetical protein
MTPGKIFKPSCPVKDVGKRTGLGPVSGNGIFEEHKENL